MNVEDTQLPTALRSLGINEAEAADAIKAADRFEYRSIHWGVDPRPAGAVIAMRSAQTGALLVWRELKAAA